MKNRAGKTYYIETWGCQMNIHDSERMSGMLRAEGYAETGDPEKADIVILNTCSIRQKAEQKFFSQLGLIRRLKKGRPEMKVVVAGCIAQQEGEGLFRRSPAVDFVVGPQQIGAVKDIAGGSAPPVSTGDNPSLLGSEFPAERKDALRAWVTIMYGCDNFCSYCVVPYTRGREQSRPRHDILREIRDLASQGFREVSLLGQNVNSYRSDVDFCGLLSEINTIEGIERIRFVTSHPKDFSEPLMTAMAELDKVCEHIHLPLQSGSTGVLRLMNRRYTYDEYRRKIDALRKKIPGIAITSDIIAGFPNETDEDHAMTMRALSELDFDGIFAFCFSPRPGTKAATMMGQIDQSVKTARLSEILALQNDVTERKNRQLKGTLQEVLIEGRDSMGRGKMTGRTRTNKIVNIAPPADGISRDLVTVRIIRTYRHSLEGDLERG